MATKKKVVAVKAEAKPADRLHAAKPVGPVTAGLGKDSMFALILTKTRLSEGVPQMTIAEWEMEREELLDIIGSVGWSRALEILASTLRLWAEVDGIIPVPEDVKETCHGMALTVGQLAGEARALDKAAKGKRAK